MSAVPVSDEVLSVHLRELADALDLMPGAPVPADLLHTLDRRWFSDDPVMCEWQGRSCGELAAAMREAAADFGGRR